MGKLLPYEEFRISLGVISGLSGLAAGEANRLKIAGTKGLLEGGATGEVESHCE